MASKSAPHRGLDSEEWRSVPGADGYWVSNVGRIVGRHGRILRGFRSGEYRAFRVGGAGGPVFLVHRAVALAFLPPPPSPAHYQVAHRDGTRWNNRASNLRWATAVENSMDRIEHGTHLRGEGIGNSRLTEAEVLAIFEAHGSVSSPKLATRYGVGVRTIRDIWNGSSWGWLTRA